MRNLIQEELKAWADRASVARKYGQEELAKAADHIVDQYKRILDLEEDPVEPEPLVQARNMRKVLESAEQHRTMCVEHGLNDAAIDATYEIQELEKRIVELVTAMRQ